MIHARVALVRIGGGYFARLRSGRTRSLGHRVAHGAMTCGLLFAFGLGRSLGRGHRVARMVLREGRGGGARQKHGDDQAHQSSPTRFISD